MSFTIQDMMLTAETRYEMKFLAGKMDGPIQSAGYIFWRIQRSYRISGGKELAVTTGLGFPEKKTGCIWHSS